MMSPSGTIIKDRDFAYSGKDANSFLRCCACRHYTPFLFYIVSKVALEAAHMDPRYNYFCVHCVPKPASVENRVMYPDDSLMKNEEFLRLFAGFRYQNPYYEKYASKNRIIITEKCKIHPSFKKVARKAMPPEVKLRKIYNLFMPVHQMVCKKYASTQEMSTDIRHKYREIIAAYCETTITRELYDHIDLMIERTPLQSQQSRHRSRTSVTDVTSPFPSDSLHTRSGDSEETQTSTSLLLGISSSLPQGNTELPESQRSVALSEQQESQSALVTAKHTNILNISSQNAENTNGSPKVVENLTPNTSIDSSSSLTLQQLAASQRSVALSEQQESQSALVTAKHTSIFDISSQDTENTNGSPKVVENLTPNTSIDSSSSTILVLRNRPLQTTVIHTGDSQEAGPSGLQRKMRKRDQQTAKSPTPKRPRRTTTKPMNPAPADVQSAQVRMSRMPRLSGG